MIPIKNRFCGHKNSCFSFANPRCHDRNLGLHVLATHRGLILRKRPLSHQKEGHKAGSCTLHDESPLWVERWVILKVSSSSCVCGFRIFLFWNREILWVFSFYMLCVYRYAWLIQDTCHILPPFPGCRPIRPIGCLTYRDRRPTLHHRPSWESLVQTPFNGKHMCKNMLKCWNQFQLETWQPDLFNGFFCTSCHFSEFWEATSLATNITKTP